ncbi:phosphoribosylanthranilate isomerase [Mucilaginibacter sp.]|uniref:phosphoribosylanthranilate isomerase n=1 Tax=Mucilaginibacter sp. TaxID=1882438 RepID=UPI002614B468|nr:phosphoribosylanthranilate isomerase [Mucilaginibacter sp.]MDB5031451.1 trpF [Mucilaginibacter sp.]
MKIKVCGLKYPDNIKAVADLDPDYIGFICYDRSPRFVSEVPADALNGLAASILKTAVFVDENEQEINRLIEEFGFDAIQLHGQETPEFANSFRNKVTVIKAFGLNEDFDFNQLNDYIGKIDYFLFDTKTDMYGGSGKTFNWKVLDKYKLNMPFFLSGGLNLDNLEQVTKIVHPQFYGVDLNSKFETAPGMKDIKKLKQAFNLLKQSTTHEIRS